VSARFRSDMFASCTSRNAPGGTSKRDVEIDRHIDGLLSAMDGTGKVEFASLEALSLINRAIFQAPRPSYTSRTHPWSPAQFAYVRSGAGYDFPCVWITSKRARAQKVVIHMHANACDVGHIYELCARDAECWRANVLLVEYPGYGASSGVAYERSVDRHVAAAYVYVTEECGVDPKDIVLLGRSLGTGPATKLASAIETVDGKTLSAVVLHSPFTSVREAGLALLGDIAHVMSDRWDNRAHVVKYKTRTLIVHALEDEVVPFEHATILHKMRQTAKLPSVLHSTHGTHNYFSYYRDYLQPINSFLDASAKVGIAPRMLPPLPDPIPRTSFSSAQVKSIMSMIAEQTPAPDAQEQSLGMRFYGMVDAMGETLPSADSTSPKKSGFTRFGGVSEFEQRENCDKLSISPTSTIEGDNESSASVDSCDDEIMIHTPGGAKPRLIS